MSGVVTHVCWFVCFRVKGPEKEEKLRPAVEQVLKCDVTQSWLLRAIPLPPADCLLSPLCRDATYVHLPACRTALKNRSSPLKLGAFLVLADALKSSYSVIGDQSLCLGPEAMEAAVREAGYTTQQFEMISQSYCSAMADNEGLFFLVG
uniref:Uncharacterized protein n=1 Tax=Capra hircus TaxID=9925 RepID=A0A8C2NZW8_CAPHI